MASKTPNVVIMLGYVDANSKDRYADMRKFYACKNNYNYVNYVSSGSKEKIDFVDYSGNYEKSDGIFGMNGLLSKDDIIELKHNLSQTQSCIWHGVISFKQEFGNLYLSNTEQAMKLIQKKFPRFFKTMGLNPQNVVWFAGLHKNTDNKHIHFSFYEKQPSCHIRGKNGTQYRNGKVNLKIINQLKNDIELYLTDWSNKIAVVRNKLTTLFMQNSNISVNKLQTKIERLINLTDFEHITSFDKFYDSEYMKAYQNEVNKITLEFIKTTPKLKKSFDDFVAFVFDRDKTIKDICKKNKVDYKGYLLADKYIKDIFRRLGNIVLKGMSNYFIVKNKKTSQYKKLLVQKHIKKRKMKELLNEINYLDNAIAKEFYDAFNEYRTKLNELNYKRLIEEGVIDIT